VPRTAIVWFTRDLRVHDQPALTAAVAEGGPVLALFVLDERILGSRYAAANRLSNLLDALHDLRAALRERGGELVVRRGDPITELRGLARTVEAGSLHASRDVSGFARAREGALEALGRELGVPVTLHPGVTLVEPFAITASGGGAFRVFTPYWRRWFVHERPSPLAAPTRVPRPVEVGDGAGAAVPAGPIPDLSELTDGATAPELARGGERAARERLAWWLDGPLDRYATGRNELGVDATSRLSPHLHLGTLSAAEVASHLDPVREDHLTFLQELCWRDFNHQLLAARPDLVREDFRSQGDRWRDDVDAFVAWREGRTGYPIVDAGMRQLLVEGFMHNRARMIVASFLTKHLYLDWRLGAWHFMDHLVDGDLANNFAQWQWSAGTGTDSRPNRIFNPVTQGERYDPDGAYVRRFVPELADLEPKRIHAPWERVSLLDPVPDYPPPLVDHREARERFLTARGR
jgi:deoxyribodipyrimidine photo-lyase